MPAAEPWSQPVDPATVRRAAAALLVEDIVTLLATTRKLLSRWVDVRPTAHDRAAMQTAGGSLEPSGPPPADPFARVGPWSLVPNWPRPLVWDAVNLALDACYRALAYEALETLVGEVRRLDLAPRHETGPDLMLACVRARQHRLVECRTIIDDVLAQQPDMPSTRRALAVSTLAFIYSQLGRGRESRDLHREAVALRRLAGDAWGEAMAVSLLGVHESHSFDLADAARLLETSRRQLVQQGQRWPAWQATFNLAIIRYKQGRPTDSLALVDLVEEPQRRAGQVQGWLLSRLVRAKALMVRGDAPQAAAVAESVLPTADAMGWIRERILALEVMGDAALNTGDRDTARDHYQAAHDLAAERAPRGDLVVGLTRRFGQVELMAGRPREAAVLLSRARGHAIEAGEIFEEIVSGRLLAGALRAGGHQDDAWPEVRDTITRARFHGAQLELARALLEGARVQAALAGRLETAWSLASESRDILTGLAEFPADHAACDSFLAALRDRWRAAIVWDVRPATARVPAPGAAAAAPAAAEGFIAGSPPMIRIAQLLALAATTDDPVLITGETGTGKEVAAARIHALSRRHDRPFVAVNCAAVPAPVFEREFFGHVRGAFTGADADGPGLVERADGGTLLLDEVGELPPELQGKLLRLLQEGTYRRLGEPTERRADLRVLAATNADLLAMVVDGRFRQDLYFRLQVLEIHLPPLRERDHDIRALAHHAARQTAGNDADAASILGPALWAALPRYDWPGNVRELTGLVRRACLYHRVGRPFTLDLAPRGLREIMVAEPRPETLLPQEDVPTLANHLATAQRQAIAQALEATANNRTEAAKLLGISRKSLYDKMKRK